MELWEARVGLFPKLERRGYTTVKELRPVSLYLVLLVENIEKLVHKLLRAKTTERAYLS